MRFVCERPAALFAICLLIPAIISVFAGLKKAGKKLNIYSLANKNSGRFRHSVILRTVFFSISWIMLVFAFAGFSWGTRFENIQKNGNAVSLVFDISYSMTAQDCPGGITRLDGAAKYSSMLLEQMHGVPVSVTLAKGEGINVIPLTEDKGAVEILLSSLSPGLMTSAGSSLGKGILAALKAFPENSGFAHIIWIFTDGDETDGMLEAALGECIKNGIKVCIVGFGSERETDIITGDGKTRVATALRSDRIKAAVSAALKKNKNFVNSGTLILYVPAVESGSAIKLLETVSKRRNFVQNTNSAIDSEFSALEVHPVLRYKIFLTLALIFFAAGFVFSEFNIAGTFPKFNRKTALIVLCPIFVFTSCKTKLNGAKMILTSAWAYEQKRYNDATVGFLQAASDAAADGNEIITQYALYGLASTYFMQNETEAAMDRFSMIAENAPAPIKYASYYNMGLIANKNGDLKSAVKYFKKALKVDGSKKDAKINLELSLQNLAQENLARTQNPVQTSEVNEPDGVMTETLFERIKKNDKKQWKNGMTSELSSSVDY